MSLRRKISRGMGNHVKKALRELPLKRGTVTLANVYHDAWCAYLRGGDCNCDPDIKATTFDPKKPEDQ